MEMLKGCQEVKGIRESKMYPKSTMITLILSWPPRFCKSSGIDYLWDSQGADIHVYIYLDLGNRTAAQLNHEGVNAKSRCLQLTRASCATSSETRCINNVIAFQMVIDLLSSRHEQLLPSRSQTACERVHLPPKPDREVTIPVHRHARLSAFSRKLRHQSCSLNNRKIYQEQL